MQDLGLGPKLTLCSVGCLECGCLHLTSAESVRYHHPHVVEQAAE